MLQGSISSIVDAVEGQRAVFYQVDMELIDIQSNEKVWLGQKEIKKVIEQSKRRLVTTMGTPRKSIRGIRAGSSCRNGAGALLVSHDAEFEICGDR